MQERLLGDRSRCCLSCIDIDRLVCRWFCCTELENQLAHARAIHDLLGNLGLESGGVLNASKQRPVSPAGMYGLLRAFLKIHDPDFQPDKICDLAKLECGMVLQEGGYRWAHRHELLQEPELYRLRVDYASDSMHSLNDTNNNHVPRTDVQPMFYLSDFQASRLASDDARLAYCTWELVDCARSVRLGSGETIQNPHEDLEDCELVVEVKRPSKLVLRSDRLVGRGSIKLSTVKTHDGEFEMVVPLTKSDGLTSCGTITCRLWSLGSTSK